MDTYRPCFASIVCKRIRRRIRLCVHITMEGLAMAKYRKDGTKRHQTEKGVIGCDIGPQSIAYTTDQKVRLKNLTECGASIKKRERKEALLARKMERSRKIMNSDNCNKTMRETDYTPVYGKHTKVVRSYSLSGCLDAKD